MAAWLKSDIDYAREALEKIAKESIADAEQKLDHTMEKRIDQASKELNKVVESGIENGTIRFNAVMRSSIDQASQQLSQVVLDAGSELDKRLERISEELHAQRSFTKGDIKELVDYAADKMGKSLDARIHQAKHEFAELVQEKTQDLKYEIDTFFIKRQEDLAQERRRLFFNLLAAVSAAVLMAAFSILYQRYVSGDFDLFWMFKVVFATLATAWGVYLGIEYLGKYITTPAYQKDFFYLLAKRMNLLGPYQLFFLSIAVITGLFALLWLVFS